MLALNLVVVFLACTDAALAPVPAEVAAIAYAKAPGQSATVETIDPTTASVETGETLQLIALDGSGQPVSAQWSSGNTGVATVSADGLVQALAAGSVEIQAKTRKERTTAEISVTTATRTVRVASVLVNPGSVGVTVGGSAQLSATALDADGNVLTGHTATWSTGAPTVATVSSSGLVTGVSEGSAVVSAEVDGVSGSATVEVTASTTTAAAAGIWIAPDEISALATSGTAWDRLRKDADRDPGIANVSDQNSNHDVYLLAAALVCVRLNSASHCTKATDGVVAAIGTEQGGRWLAVGRNLTAYVVAADVLGLRADGDPNSNGSRVHAWIESFLTMRLPDNNTGELVPLVPFASGSNASAQEGAAYAAVAAYVGSSDALARVWDAFRTYACDPTAPDREGIDLSKGVENGWAHDDSAPCAVNPAGTTKVVPAGQPGAGEVHRIDGSIINDMRRGGHYQWVPGYTSYPWVGLEGFVPAALILDRAGYPAFEVADRAVLRTHEYLWHLREATGDTRWFDGVRADEVVHLVNRTYGASFPVAGAVGAGRTVGYTDWTHPRR